MMRIKVLQPGMLTTVQDAGRQGWRRYGVGRAGALDAFSYAVGNLLVGNPAGAAGLEMTLSGATLAFEAATRIAITGAEIDAATGDMQLPGWRPIDLPAGSVVKFGPCRRGVRAYLCVSGGLIVPRVLGSASTDLRGGFGGMRGRMLAAGDVLPIGEGFAAQIAEPQVPGWWIDAAPDIDFHRSTVIRVLPGADRCAGQSALFDSGWRIAPASNRQAVRLEGPALSAADQGERISEPVAPGTIQLPPDGQPIVLLADAQTVGGYPRIGHAISADLPRQAQLRPGESVHFMPCDPEQARALQREQRARLARIGYAIAQRMR
jgi:antagonist of KipI